MHVAIYNWLIDVGFFSRYTNSWKLEFLGRNTNKPTSPFHAMVFSLYFSFKELFGHIFFFSSETIEMFWNNNSNQREREREKNELSEEPNQSRQVFTSVW